MPQDWSLYEADIIKHYLEDGRNANDTIGMINRKHGCSITIRQFKSKYGGLKKLQAREWKAVGDEVKKRQARGQASCVFLHNRLQDPARVNREIRHYSNHAPNKNSDAIDIGIETAGKHRIEIRSPATAHVDNVHSSNASVAGLASDVCDTENSNHSSQSVEPCQLTAIGELSHTISVERNDYFSPPLLSPSFYHMPEFESMFQGHKSSSSSLYNTPRHISYQPVEFDFTEICHTESNLTFHNSNNHWPQPWNMDVIMSENPSVSILPKRAYPLFWNEPELAPIFLSLTSLSISSSGYMAPAGSHGNRGWLLTHLADITPNIPGIQSFAENIEEVIPTTPRKRKTQAALDNVTSDLLRCAFSVVAYLASNNLLSDLQLRAFVYWIIDNDHIRQFTKLLQTKSQNIQQFIPKILLAACPPKNEVLYYYTHGGFSDISKSSLVDYDNIFDSHPSETITLLRQIDQRTLSSSVGSNLLVAASSSEHEQAARLLIDQGANLNGNGDGNPLILSIARGSGIISKLLIDSGADVNIKAIGRHGHEITPLLAAVAYQRCDTIVHLLEAGAKVDVMSKFADDLNPHPYILGRTAQYYPEIHEVLVRHMTLDDISETWLMVEQAQKGNAALADFLVARKITEVETLEKALFYAVKWCDVDAIITFLSRGVDANATKFRLQRKQVATITNPENGSSDNDQTNNSDDFHPLLEALSCSHYPASSIIYLLVKYGARIHHLPDSYKYSPNNLEALVHAGHDMTNLGLPMVEKIQLSIDSVNILDIGRIVDAGCPINSYGAKGRSLLQIVASDPIESQSQRGQDAAVVQYLINRGADVNLAASEDGGRTALQGALEKGNIKIVDCLLRAGADVMAPPAKTAGLTTLEAAARGFSRYRPEHISIRDQVQKSYQIRRLQKAVEKFKWLFARGAPVTRADGDSGELHHLLIDVRNAECLELALKGGAVADGPSIPFRSHWDEERPLDEMTPLQFAAKNVWLDGVVLLLRSGANVNAPAVSAHSLTALQSASWPITLPDMPDADFEIQIKVVKLLLQSGAEVNAPAAEEYGRTALQAACSVYRPNHQLIRLLFEHKADVNAQPARVGGVTALQGAVMMGDMPLVKVLFQKGAKINAPASEEEGRTAVEGAAEYERLDILRFLLNEGAEPDEATGFSKAVELATKKENWAIVDLLKGEQGRWGLLPLPLSN